MIARFESLGKDGLMSAGVHHCWEWVSIQSPYTTFLFATDILMSWIFRAVLIQYAFNESVTSLLYFVRQQSIYKGVSSMQIFIHSVVQLDKTSLRVPSSISLIVILVLAIVEPNSSVLILFFLECVSMC